MKFYLLAALASAELITSTLPPCNSPEVDDSIKIHPMCDGTSGGILASTQSDDCSVFKYLWKLSLRPTESCVVDASAFGTFQYDSHCNTQNLQAKYTYSVYPDSGPTDDKSLCTVPSNGRDVAIQANEKVDSRQYCDMMVTVTASAPLNIPDTTDCHFFNVYAQESAKYLAAGATAAALVLANLV